MAARVLTFAAPLKLRCISEPLTTILTDTQTHKGIIHNPCLTPCPHHPLTVTKSASRHIFFLLVFRHGHTKESNKCWSHSYVLSTDPVTGTSDDGVWNFYEFLVRILKEVWFI
ncbi:hypothetical protein CEXT_421991 [Caerostris extrusa]|uniref:Uncharacterized protein n=1 Tax=Caerostris extrusa TaxID=172846 RepID=A0AAV4NQU7_CAEEX|nr:hypothetical protein CEXT_421991 [Caerostris extrusa]